MTTSPARVTIASRSRRGVRWTVLVFDDPGGATASCECEAARFENPCWHARYALRQLGLAPPDEEGRRHAELIRDGRPADSKKATDYLADLIWGGRTPKENP